MPDPQNTPQLNPGETLGEPVAAAPQLNPGESLGEPVAAATPPAAASPVAAATSLIQRHPPNLETRDVIPKETPEQQAARKSAASSVSEGAMDVGELASWVAGDEALSGVGRMIKIANKFPKVFDLIEQYPTAAKLILGTTKGAATGATVGAGKAEVEGKSVTEGAKKGAEGGAVGGGIAGGVGGLAESTLAQKFINKSLGLTARDVLHGNPAKALLDEGIISPQTGNMAAFHDALKAGKPLEQAIEAAGGRVMGVSEKLNELTPQLERVLKNSPARISIDNTLIQPLKQAQADIASNSMLEPNVAKNAEDALNAWQQRIQTLIGTGSVNAETAVNLKRQLDETLNFTKNAAVDDIVESVRMQLRSNLSKAVHTQVPEAAELDSRISNLMSAWNKLNPSKPGSLPAQELVSRGPGMEAGNFWDIPQRIIASVGKVLPLTHAVAGSSAARGAAEEAATAVVPSSEEK